MPSSQPWSTFTFTSTSEAHRRASGRRRYNAVRRFHADVRRIEVARLTANAVPEHGRAINGLNVRIARALEVIDEAGRDLRPRATRQ
jgi:hypothetical protein